MGRLGFDRSLRPSVPPSLCPSVPLSLFPLPKFHLAQARLFTYTLPTLVQEVIPIPPTFRLEGAVMIRCSRCSGELPAFAVFCPHCAQAHTPDFDDLINLTIDGRYHIYRRLGQGGLSTVFA